MNPKFEAFLDKARMPIFVLVIIAAIFIDYADRSYFGQLFAANNTAPVVAQQTQTATNMPMQTAAASTTAGVPSAEITLDDQSSFPTSVTTGQIVSFSFTITNTTDSTGSPQAGMAATFPYKVYVDWNTGEEDVIDENILTLDAGQSQTIPEELKFEAAGDKGEIFIKLQNAGQTVQFALPAAQ